MEFVSLFSVIFFWNGLFWFTAEFVIDLAVRNETFDRFKKVLAENEAQFSDSLIASLLRLIQHMRPKAGKTEETSIKSLDSIIAKEGIKAAFPGLSLPNDPSVRVSQV
jgi:ATP-dependent RNA helicase DHX8/PRP22